MKWKRKENAHIAYSATACRDHGHRHPHGAGDRDSQRQARLKPQRSHGDAVELSLGVRGFGVSARCWSWRFGALGRAARLHARAVVHRDAGRLSSALQAAIKARMVVERRRGESSPDAAVVWHTIGTIREELSDYEGADTAYRRAAAILDSNRGDETLTPVRACDEIMSFWLVWALRLCYGGSGRLGGAAVCGCSTSFVGVPATIVAGSRGCRVGAEWCRCGG